MMGSKQLKIKEAKYMLHRVVVIENQLAARNLPQTPHYQLDDLL